MVARATQVGEYTSDILSVNFRRRVDDHLFSQTSALGWAAPTTATLAIPRSLRPRHAVGKDATGATHSVVCATTGCDLWTRATAQWNILGDDGALVAVTATGLVGEAYTFV